MIVGNQIWNTQGERVVLRGVAINEPLVLIVSPRIGHFAAEDYRTVAHNWGANIIRVPIYPSTWVRDPLYMEKVLNPLVQWGGEYGFYVFLGWHAHGNPVTGKEEALTSVPSWSWRSPPSGGWSSDTGTNLGCSTARSTSWHTSLGMNGGRSQSNWLTLSRRPIRKQLSLFPALTEATT